MISRFRFGRKRRQTRLRTLGRRCDELARYLRSKIEFICSGGCAIKFISSYNRLRYDLADEQIYIERYRGTKRSCLEETIAILDRLGSHLSAGRERDIRREFGPITWATAGGSALDRAAGDRPGGRAGRLRRSSSNV